MTEIPVCRKCDRQMAAVSPGMHSRACKQCGSAWIVSCGLVNGVPVIGMWPQKEHEAADEMLSLFPQYELAGVETRPGEQPVK